MMWMRKGAGHTFLRVTNPVSEVVRSGEEFVNFAEGLFQQMDTLFRSAKFRISKQVAGSRCQISTTIGGQAKLFAERIAEAQAVVGVCAPFRVLVVSAQDVGLAAPPIVAGSLMDPLELERALSSTRWRAHHHAATKFWQIWDRDSRTGLQLMAEPEILPPWENGSPLRNLLKWALTGPTQGLLHAGTLAVDGRGMFFVGQGGSGKSGTVLAGLCDGLQSVGDDYVLARVEGDKIYAVSLLQTLKCDLVGLRRLGLSERTELRARGENWQEKYEFTFSQLTGQSPAQALMMSAICLPVIAGAERTYFEPLSQREAFLALTLTGLAQLPGDRAENFALCAEITRRLACVRLVLSADASEVANTIRSALVEGARGW